MANEIKALTIDGTRRTIKDETARNAAQQAQTTANSKQDELTFDTAPTSGSNNPVTSGGVYTAMQSFAPELPIASEDTLGGVKVDGTTITADENGVISGASTYTLPTASTSQLGGVKIDGDTVNIDANGVISTAPSAQSDWDETDSTDPAYIVNKPFGYVAGDVTIIEQASYGGSSVTYEGTINNTRYAAVDEVTATEDITNNTEYKITVDGTAYTVTSRNVSSTFANSDDTRLFEIIGYGIVTPYCAIVRSTYEQSLGSIFVLLATNGQWTTVPSRTVKLEKDGEVIMQIDPDFLPAATSSDYGAVKVDSAISSSSANPVQNQAIKQAIDDLQSAILTAQTLLNAIGTVPIANGGTGATTAAGAKANLVDGQALAPASVASTGAVSGSSVSDSVGSLASLRESVSQTFRFTKLNSSLITIPNGQSVSLPDGYTSATMALICGYGYDGMRFTHLGAAGSINIPVAATANAIGKISVNVGTGTITNSTGASVTISAVYAVTMNR